MKFCISIIHLGRYKIDMLDENNQIMRGYDCGLAGVLVALNNWLFVPEHIAYQGDQRRSSEQLASEVTPKLFADKTLNPKGFTHTPTTCPDHIASAHDPKVCGRCGTHINELI